MNPVPAALLLAFALAPLFPAAELSRGLLIGVLERALALTLVLVNQLGALGLILAAKALGPMSRLPSSPGDSAQ